MLKISYTCPKLKEVMHLSSEIRGTGLETSELEESLDCDVYQVGRNSDWKQFEVTLLVHCDCGSTHTVWSL